MPVYFQAEALVFDELLLSALGDDPDAVIEFVESQDLKGLEIFEELHEEICEKYQSFRIDALMLWVREQFK